MAIGLKSHLSVTSNPDVYYNEKLKIVSYLSITDMTMPYDFIGLTAVLYNNEIHVIGGNNASSDNVTYHIKWNGTQWVDVSTVPIAYVDGRAVVCDGEIHLFSGTLHYSFNGSSWTERNLPSGIDTTGSSTVVYNSKLHILGGSSNSTMHYYYNGSRWVSASTLPRNFSSGCAIVYDNALHIMGGSNANHYKWDGSSWELVSSSAPTFANGCAVIYDDCIYFIKTSTYIYNGTSWASKSGVLFSPTYCVAVVYKNRVFYMGNAANARRFCFELGDSLLSNYSIT